MDEASCAAPLPVFDGKVRCRSIYDSRFLEIPIGLRIIEQAVAAGEEARILPYIRTKLKLADDTAALLPATPTGMEASMKIYAPPIVAAMREYFELLWEKAIPFGTGECAGELTKRQQKIITLMATGMEDEAISHHLGLSTGTVRREIGVMREILDVVLRDSPSEQPPSGGAGSVEYDDFIPIQRFQLSTAAAISPDASTVAYSTNVSGQYNLWIQPLAPGGPARRLTGFTRIAVRGIAWAPDGRTLVFAADQDGDEQYQLYQVSADDGALEQLTTAEGRQHELAAAPYDAAGRHLLYSANDRVPDTQDMIIRDLSDGTLRRILPPDGIRCEPIGISPDGTWLLATGYRAHTDTGAFLIDLTAADPQAGEVTPGGGIFEPIGWAADSAGFYLKTTLWGGEFTSVGYYDLHDQSIRPVVQADWDIEHFAASADDRCHAWTVNEAGRSVLHVRRDAENPPLPSMPNAVIDTMDMSAGGTAIALLIDGATRPADIAVVDLRTAAFRYLTDSRPRGLRITQPIEPARITFPSDEGRTIFALQYRPDQPGRHPVVMWIHGGPHGQARPIYERIGLFQFLLTQGIGVLCPDASGSTGYGTSFEKRLDRDWGGADLRDFDAAMTYLRSLDWVDSGRIAVFGGSYGGFATLSCLARLDYPWAAGVSACGPSNLVTLSTACPPTWRHFVDTILGNPQTDRELLTSRSPITYADQITAPLFVIQGAKDPRVPQSESDQIVEKVRANGVPVRYDIYPDEGHGFTSRANEIKAYSDIAEFLLAHLQPR